LLANTAQFVIVLISLFAVCLTTGIKGQVNRSDDDRTEDFAALNIPIEVDNNIVLVNVSVNGKSPVKMILDTGASATIVNADRAESLGLKGITGASGSATGGKIEGKMAIGVSIGVSNMYVDDAHVVIVPMTRTPGFEFDGILGSDFFNDFVVEIDYLNKVMDLYVPLTFRYRGRGRIVPLKIAGRKTPAVAASFRFKNGQRVDANLELDTGADSAFLLNDSFVKRFRLLRTSKGLTQTIGRGADGEQERVLGAAKQVTFGSFLFSDVPVFFSLQKNDASASDQIDGIVGGEVLRRFKVIIDYSRSRMILEPNKSLKEPFDVEGP